MGVEGGSKFVELHIRKSKTDQRGQGAQVITITCTSTDGTRIADCV